MRKRVTQTRNFDCRHIMLRLTKLRTHSKTSKMFEKQCYHVRRIIYAIRKA